jgi:Kef-type K+ transport system membrane component KefB
VAWLAGRLVMPRLGRLMHRIGIIEAEFSVVLMVGFGYAVLAELFGLHFIVGAFFAGLYVTAPTTMGHEEHEEIRKKVQGLTMGFLAPLFFVSIGLSVVPKAVVEVPLFVAGVTVLAFVTKFAGAAIPARIAGFDRRDSLAIGAGMSARGAVELIIADIALKAGLFSVPDPPPPILANMFSAIVVMAIATTIATPILLRWILGPGSGESSPESAAKDEHAP